MRLAAVLLAIAVTTTAARTAQAQSGCSPVAIDSVRVLGDVFRLADDSMKGRRLGTPGGAMARDFLATQFDVIGLGIAGGGRVAPFPAGDLHGANVVGVIRGRTAPESWIVVSAHYDHLGVGPPVAGDSIYNGADDNGSGAAGLLAIARHFVAQPPAHSLLFVAFDGEEEGDLGSRALVAKPPVPLANMLIDVNLDMVGRNANGELYAAGPNRFPALRPAVEATAACAGLKLIIGHDVPGDRVHDDWTGQSDQAAFFAAGIPFVYFGEEDHPDYHRPSDSADRLMPGFYMAAVRAAIGFIRRFDAAPVSRQP
ncbi:MAG: M28 family peptidase [Gemmatimonadales bacterium]